MSKFTEAVAAGEAFARERDFTCSRCKKVVDKIYNTTEGLLCEPCLADRMHTECEAALVEREVKWPDEI
jgi:hypothetical protein